LPWLQVSLAHRKVLMKDQETLLGLHELLTYGLKGMAAYAHHAGAHLHHRLCRQGHAWAHVSPTQ
jgi:hypothetical protein